MDSAIINKNNRSINKFNIYPFILIAGICRIFFYFLKGLRQTIYSYYYNLLIRTNRCYYKYPVNIILGEKYITIGHNTTFGKLVILTAWNSNNGEKYHPDLTIGECCCFGDYLHLTCCNKITIGSNVLTGRWVTITDNGHGSTTGDENIIPPRFRKLYSKGPVTIGDNVWIGDKVTILPGVSIGENCIIGANTVVSKNVPSNSIAVGNPAKIIKRTS